jgi:hypothetical protein
MSAAIPLAFVLLALNGAAAFYTVVAKEQTMRERLIDVVMVAMYATAAAMLWKAGC